MGLGGLVSPVSQYVQGVIGGWLRQIIVNDAIPGLLIVQTGAGYALAIDGRYVGGDLATSTATGAYSTSHGVDCDVSGDWAGIGSGNENDVTGDYSFIGGGDDNVINAHRSFIGGGENHSITDAYGTIGGGYTNLVSGGFGTVAGGNNNTASGDYSFVGGGGTNTAGAGDYSAVGGGSGNTASGLQSTVGGGAGNVASSSGAAVAGGRNNTASGPSDASVAGGNANTASGDSSAVGGGYRNTASGDWASIPGGRDALADKYGQFAHASGYFAVQGDAQFSRLIVRNVITHDDANWHDLFTDGAAALMTIPADTLWQFEVKLVGVAQGLTERFAYHLNDGVIENDGGTTTLRSGTFVADYETDAAFAAQVIGDNANDCLTVQVMDAGSTGDIIRWMATVDLVQVSWPAA